MMAYRSAGVNQTSMHCRPNVCPALQDAFHMGRPHSCRDEKDEANAADKKGDMSGFYGNLMTKNVAFGGTRCDAASFSIMSFCK